MRERSIFLTALEKEDLAVRAAYLDRTCAGNSELRRRIEDLLRAHEEAQAFLNVPALEQMATAEMSLSFLEPPDTPDVLGWLDHYQVLEVVGRGGTGVVLKARDSKLQRIVAIKVLAPRLAASGRARQRFVREAQAAAAVRDDHVVAIHAVSDDGLAPYLVMEFIDGITLDERVRRAGALELAEVLRIGMQLANGLAAAHAQGVIHRDIKPANILLENGVQRVKVTDFGLAWVAGDADPAKAKVLAGTPPYMSPEQARGEPTDHRTDLFSLGSVLYTLCAGKPPFRADTTAGVLKSVCEDTAAPLGEISPGVPAWLCTLIGKLHAKAVNDRFATAREVADLLAGQLALLQEPPRISSPAPPLSSEPGIEAAPASLVAPSSKRRRFGVAASLFGLLIALTALTLIWLGPNLWRQFWQGSEIVPEVPDDGARPEDLSAPLEPLELRREDIPPGLLALAGAGDPALAPADLVAVLGDGRFLLPRVGQTAWMAQSPDGKILAVPLDADVVLFECPSGRYLRTLKGPGGRAIGVIFSPDGQLLAATVRTGQDWYGLVRVSDLRSGRELLSKEIPGPQVFGGAAFSPDSKRLIAEDDDRIHVWDARTGQELQTLEIRPGGVHAMCFSPDGRRLAMAIYNGKTAKVFDWDGDNLTLVRALGGHRSPVWGVAYSPDGKYLATSEDNAFKLWNATSLQEIRTIEVPAQRVAFTPDSRVLLAATTTDKEKAVHTFRRWAVDGLAELPPLSVEVSAEPMHAYHCLSRDGRVLFAGPRWKMTYVRAVDTDTGKELFPRLGHTAALHAVAASPDGRTLASAGADRLVKLWDLATRRVRHSLGPHVGTVGALAFTRDGKQLASASSDGTIILWNVNGGDEVRTLKGHSHSVSSIQFSPDGRTLVAGADNGTVKRWDVASGKEQIPLAGHAGAVRCVAFSPDAARVASGGEDKTIHVQRLVDGSAQKFSMPNAVNDVAFSWDGRTLAAVCDAPQSAVCLWDMETGKETTWTGHEGRVHGLAFSPTAPLLATCGEDGTVRLWNLEGGSTPMRTFGPGPFGGGVRGLAFTPDGRYLATANANGTVYVLKLPKGGPPADS
jgi:WD40 repeat protein/serine/threonine protein kinase